MPTRYAPRMSFFVVSDWDRLSLPAERGRDDAAPCPNLDRPPGGGAEWPCDDPNDAAAVVVVVDADNAGHAEPVMETTITIEPCKSILAVWVTTCANQTHEHLGTWVVSPEKPCEIRWQPGGLVGFVVVANRGQCGWHGSTTWHAAGRLAHGKGPCVLSCVAPTVDGKAKPPLDIAVQLAGGCVTQYEYERPPTGGNWMFHFADQTWGAPLHVCGGYKVLTDAGTIIPLDDPEPIYHELARRWLSYYESATMLADMNGGKGAFERLDRRIKLAVVLQRAATSYTLEKIDDRGPTSLTFGLNDDCDGQSAEVAVFANQMIRYNGVLAAKIGPGPQTALLESLLVGYQRAGMMFCFATSPVGGKNSQQFGHAVCVLIRRDAEPDHILRGGLLVEATGPTSTLRNTEPGGLANGLIANDLCNERTGAVREMLARAGNQDSPVQIVGGIRQRYDWFYGEVLAVILDDAIYDGNCVQMNKAFAGDRAVVRIECTCPDAYANEEPVRRGLTPRLFRTADQTAGLAIEHPYRKSAPQLMGVDTVYHALVTRCACEPVVWPRLSSPSPPSAVVHHIDRLTAGCIVTVQKQPVDIGA